MSRPPARTRGLKSEDVIKEIKSWVASSREDAWIEIAFQGVIAENEVASSREDAWIEMSPFARYYTLTMSRPPARTRGLKSVIA